VKGVLILGGLIFMVFYFLPTWIALARDVPHKFPIFLLNFLFGWSVVCWCIALVFALGTTKTAVEGHGRARTIGY
jgi:hypothetical protein